MFSLPLFCAKEGIVATMDAGIVLMTRKRTTKTKKHALKIVNKSLWGCAVLLSACVPPPLKGDLVSRIKLEALLQDNQCGTGLQFVPQYQFQGELRKHVQTPFWYTNGGASASGRINSEGEYVFQFASYEARTELCTLERKEELVLKLTELTDDDAGVDAGSSDAGLNDAGNVDAGNMDAGFGDAGVVLLKYRVEGTNKVTVTPGGNCADQLAVVGGGFPTLPCSVQFGVTGKGAPEY